MEIGMLQAEVSSEVAKETKAEDFVAIDIPPIVNPSPEKVSILDSSSAVYQLGSSSAGESNSEHQPGTLTIQEVAKLALGWNSPPKSSVAINRAASMPAMSFKPLFPNGSGEYQPIYRSISVPVTDTNVTKTDDNVRVFRVVPHRRSTERRNTGSLSSSALPSGRNDEDNITEEEALCRICLEELGDDLNTFKLECDCKGDLALVHKHCSERWFNLRGTRTCEICGQRVKNVTVRVTRRMNTSFWNQFQPPPMTYTDMIWHGILLLFVVSMMFYTLSIELIRSRRRKVNTNEQYGALSASIVLALLTSTAAAAFGQWRVVWIHAVLQFVVFTVFAEIFFDLCRMGPLATLVLATVLAIGIGRGAEPAYRAVKKWRETQLNQANNNNLQDDALQIEFQVGEETNERNQSDANHHEVNEETDERPQSDVNHHESNEETAESHHSDASSLDSSETEESHQSDRNSFQSIETARSHRSEAKGIDSG